mmetsp:Transcript_7454/g.28235  ORF Transcript_7454/g.28235 Transcript_7454/m.28235 type:complete len:469 (+) Transcript_7454:1724-3130(+)
MLVPDGIVQVHRTHLRPSRIPLIGGGRLVHHPEHRHARVQLTDALGLRLLHWRHPVRSVHEVHDVVGDLPGAIDGLRGVRLGLIRVAIDGHARARRLRVDAGALLEIERRRGVELARVRRRRLGRHAGVFHFLLVEDFRLVLGHGRRGLAARVRAADLARPADLQKRRRVDADRLKELLHGQADQRAALGDADLRDQLGGAVTHEAEHTTSVTGQQPLADGAVVGDQEDPQHDSKLRRLEESELLLVLVLQQALHHQVGGGADDGGQASHDGAEAERDEELGGREAARAGPVTRDGHEQRHEGRVVEESTEGEGEHLEAEKTRHLGRLLPKHLSGHAVHDAGALHAFHHDEQRAHGDHALVAEAAERLAGADDARVPHDHEAREHDHLRSEHLEEQSGEHAHQHQQHNDALPGDLRHLLENASVALERRSASPSHASCAPPMDWSLRSQGLGGRNGLAKGVARGGGAE